MEENKQSPVKLWFFSILIYVVANLFVEIISGLLSGFSDIKIANTYSIFLSLLPALYFYQRYKSNFNEKKKEIKKVIIGSLGLLIIIPAVLAIWLRSNTGNSELERLLSVMNSTVQQVRNDVLRNKFCFEDESLQNGKSGECITKLRNIQNTFRGADEENLNKLELYYQINQSSLDVDTKRMIENSLKLYKSGAYSDLISAYNQYFSAYIEWHKYFRDYVGIKGVDILTSEETMKARDLAQSVVSAEENLQLKVNVFSDFTNENFDKEFVNAIATYKESLKE